jgi:WD40 repeat protein
MQPETTGRSPQHSEGATHTDQESAHRSAAPWDEPDEPVSPQGEAPPSPPREAPPGVTSGEAEQGLDAPPTLPTPAARRLSRRALLRAGIGAGALGTLVWLLVPRRQVTLVSPPGARSTRLPSPGATPSATAVPPTTSPAATGTPPPSKTPAATSQPTATPPPTATPIPLGQILLTCRGHSEAVTGVVWSPDGTRVAAASLDTTVQVWDATSGQRLLSYTGHQDFVWAAAWSPNSKQIASGSADGTVQIWDAVTGIHGTLFQGATDVLSVAWSPDGQSLAAGSADNSVHVWAMPEGRLLLTYQHAKGGGVYSVVWSPDSQRVASAGAEAIQLWTPANATHLRSWAPPDTTTDVLAWSPGPHLASAPFLATASTKQITIWDAGTGQALQTLPAQVQLQVLCLAWSPDGTRLAWGGGNSEGIQMRPLAANATSTALQGKIVQGVAWSPDGTRLACGLNDGTVLVVTA